MNPIRNADSSNGARKIFLFLLVTFFSLAPHVLAQGFVPLAPITGLTDPNTANAVVNSQSLAIFFNNLYKYLIGLAAVLAVIEIIWGGLEISTQDSVSKQSAGKERITQALFGLVLVLSPVIVFSIINPSILNLSLNLPKLDTASGLPAGTGNGTGNSTAATAAGCSASLIALGATNSASVGCPTQQAAQDFAASCSNGPGQIYSTGDPSIPYQASCNVLQPFQGHRDYTDKTQIPSSYWCYVTRVTVGSTAVPTYICGANKNSCDALVISNAGGGTYAGGCRASPY